MRIHRSQLDSGFTQVPNDTLRDDRLSYLARGILGELLSNKDGWHETADTLAVRARKERGSEGRRKVQEAFAELVTAGYLRHTRTRDARGRWRTELEIYDLALLTDIPDGGMSVRPAETRIVAGGTDIPVSGGSVDRPAGNRSVIKKTITEDHKEDEQAEHKQSGVAVVSPTGGSPQQPSGQQQHRSENDERNRQLAALEEFMAQPTEIHVNGNAPPGRKTGRKPVADTKRLHVLDLYNAGGMTLRQIATTAGVGLGTVHKVIHSVPS